MIFLVILLTIFVIILSYTSYNLYNKLLFFEDKIYEIENDIKLSIKYMKAIDLNGAFESDDEVGQVFDQMKNIVYSLEEILYEEKKE